jgi:hypothetical protein
MYCPARITATARVHQITLLERFPGVLHALDQLARLPSIRVELLVHRRDRFAKVGLEQHVEHRLVAVEIERAVSRHDLCAEPTPSNHSTTELRIIVRHHGQLRRKIAFSISLSDQAPPSSSFASSSSASRSTSSISGTTSDATCVPAAPRARERQDPRLDHRVLGDQVRAYDGDSHQLAPALRELELGQLGFRRLPARSSRRPARDALCQVWDVAAELTSRHTWLWSRGRVPFLVGGLGSAIFARPSTTTVDARSRPWAMALLTASLLTPRLARIRPGTSSPATRDHGRRQPSTYFEKSIS